MKIIFNKNVDNVKKIVKNATKEKTALNAFLNINYCRLVIIMYVY